MVQRGTFLKVADNSGAKRLLIIGIPGNSKRRFAKIGEIVICSVKGASSNQVAKDHSVVKAVIVRVAKEYKRKDGSYIRFDDNAAVLINKDNLPLGTRVFGPVAKELREGGFSKIESLAPEVW